jgi:hypothetical protein
MIPHCVHYVKLENRQNGFMVVGMPVDAFGEVRLLSWVGSGHEGASETGNVSFCNLAAS